MWLILLDLDNLCGFLLLVTSIYHRNDGLGEIDESLTCNGVDMTGCRFAFVAAFTDTLHERNLGEQWGLHLLGESLAAFLAEDIISVLGQFGWRKPCHILHQTENRHVYLIVSLHVDTLAVICQSHVLWCAYYHSSRNGKCLKQSEMDVARAWGSVEDEIV